MRPRDLAVVIATERRATLDLFDQLSDADLQVEALPGWSVADVFRHLADSDRRSVLGGHLRHLLPGKDLYELERANDRNLRRLRGRGRTALRGDLESWGRRLGRIVRFVPDGLGARSVPTAFGKVPVAWLGALRVYDEWVHRWDVHRATDRDEPGMATATREALAWFQTEALRADAVARARPSHGAVRLVFDDVASGPWVARLADAALDTGDGSVASTITTDVPTWCLIAADRRTWRDLADAGRLRLDGDEGVAAALLDVVRVV